MMILVSLPADHISIPNHIVIRYNIFLIYLNIYRQHLGIFGKKKILIQGCLSNSGYCSNNCPDFIKAYIVF